MPRVCTRVIRTRPQRHEHRDCHVRGHAVHFLMYPIILLRHTSGPSSLRRTPRESLWQQRDPENTACQRVEACGELRDVVIPRPLISEVCVAGARTSFKFEPCGSVQNGKQPPQGSNSWHSSPCEPKTHETEHVDTKHHQEGTARVSFTAPSRVVCITSRLSDRRTRVIHAEAAEMQQSHETIQNKWT